MDVFELRENDTCPAVCVTLTDVMAGLDRDVTVNVVTVESNSAVEGTYTNNITMHVCVMSSHRSLYVPR